MKIFLCWSGDQSQKLAKALRWWLPVMNPAFETWLSSDISHGERWREVMHRALADSSFGLVCVTPDSLACPWLMFEAGALVGALSEARVVPYLLHVDGGDVKGTPLGFFQSRGATCEGTFQLVSTLNTALPDESRQPEADLRSRFDSLWSRLDNALGEIELSSPTVTERNAHAAVNTQSTTDEHDLGSGSTTELHELIRGQGDLRVRLTDLETNTREGLSTAVRLLSRIVSQLDESRPSEDLGVAPPQSGMSTESVTDADREAAGEETSSHRPSAESRSTAPSRRADSAAPLSQPPEWSAALDDYCLEHATLQDLIELIARGRITPDTPVRKEGMGDFCEARRFAELSATFREAAAGGSVY